MNKFVFPVLIALLILPSWVSAIQDKQDKEVEEKKLTPKEAKELQARLDAEFAVWDELMAAQMPADATRIGKDFLAQFPESERVPLVHKQLVIAYQQLNDFDNLVKHGDLALAGLPQDPHVRPIMALAFAENDQNNRAIDYAEQALQVLETAPRPEELSVGEWEKQKFRAICDSHYAQGMAFLKKSMGSGNTTVVANRAIEHFEKAAEADPIYDRAYYRLGFMFARKNEADKAIEYYARTVAANGIASGMAQQDLERIFDILKKDRSEIKKVTEEQSAWLQQKATEREAYIQKVEEEERLRQQQLLQAQQEQLEQDLERRK